MWFLFALFTTLAWGGADLFYKRGADEGERYSHLKTAMTVGFVMGAHALCMLAFGNIGYNPLNLLRYAPVSLMYISSMTVGYFGLRYLELSISAPIQNASGAVVSILCFVVLGQRMSALNGIAAALICSGVFALGVLERRRMRQYEALYARKYKIGFTAFLMPVLYCVLDSLGTFFDAYYLDSAAATPLVDVTEATLENVANVSYELTFLLCALVILGFLLYKKEPLRLPRQRERLRAALLETAGQFTYVFAMSGNGIVAAPLIASYCIASVLFSRIFLKEKLTRAQYFTASLVMLGVLLMGISEALAA